MLPPGGHDVNFGCGRAPVQGTRRGVLVGRVVVFVCRGVGGLIESGVPSVVGRAKSGPSFIVLSSGSCCGRLGGGLARRMDRFGSSSRVVRLYSIIRIVDTVLSCGGVNSRRFRGVHSTGGGTGNGFRGEVFLGNISQVRWLCGRFILLPVFGRSMFGQSITGGLRTRFTGFLLFIG